MRSVEVKAKAKNITIEEAWKLITDIENYPKRVKYVKKVKSYGTGVGSQWDDVTAILWFPLTLHHTVTACKKNKEYSFMVPLQFGGKMYQTYTLVKEPSGSVKFNGIITYDLGNKILNNTIGTILDGKLKKMLVSTVRTIGAQVE